MRYPNVLWAISQIGNRYKFAAAIGHSESWLSRRLVGRVAFSSEERQIVANALGYAAEWLFQEPEPPIQELGESASRAISPAEVRSRRRGGRD